LLKLGVKDLSPPQLTVQDKGAEFSDLRSEFPPFFVTVGPISLQESRAEPPQIVPVTFVQDVCALSRSGLLLGLRDPPPGERMRRQAWLQLLLTFVKLSKV
jgi:hypothetical protein